MLCLLALLPALAAASPIAKRATNQWIQSVATGQCLSLPGGTYVSDGAQLVMVDCGKLATQWDVSPGSGSVLVSNTNYALDAGTTPSDYTHAKIWTSYPGVSQQTWFLTGDKYIAITGGTECLDVGSPNPGYPQTYTCQSNNPNQQWNLVTPTPGYVTSSTSPTATPTSSQPSSSTSSMPAHATTTLRTRRQLQWGGGNKCLTVQGGSAYNGVPVTMEECRFTDESSTDPQEFNYPADGSIQWYGNTGYCLDAGSNPANGVGMKLWQCYSGAPQQTWNHNGNLWQTANNECLDVDNNGNTKLQTWSCSSSDPQQQFYVV